MKITVAIIINDGFEEIEMVTPLDILRRKDIEVTLIGYKTKIVTGIHHLVVQADNILSDVLSQTYDCLILPGGPGCYNMRGDNKLYDLVREHFHNNKLVCAICAAPLLLHDAGILTGKRYTAHPCTNDELTDTINEPVVVDNHLITAYGPGAATRFGFTILQHLTDKKTASHAASTMLYPEGIF